MDALPTFYQNVLSCYGVHLGLSLPGCWLVTTVGCIHCNLPEIRGVTRNLLLPAVSCMGLAYLLLSCGITCCLTKGILCKLLLFNNIYCFHVLLQLSYVILCYLMLAHIIIRYLIWDQTGPNRTKRYQTGPNGTKQDHTGPYGTIWDHT